MFRVYVAESLRLMGEGKYIRTPYEDFLRPRQTVDVDAVINKVAAALEGD